MEAEELAEMGKAGASQQPEARTSSCELTLRERWRRTMYYQSIDRRPNFEFGYWAQTLGEWHQQGLPVEVKDEKTAYEYFGIERWTGVGADLGLRPDFGHKILAEDEETTTYQDGSGCTAQINKRGHKSIPHYIDFRLKDRAAWQEYKERLQPDPGRIWGNPADYARIQQRRDTPLSIGIGSLIGTPRNWMGFERIAMMVYDDPDLLEEIVETSCQLILATLEPVLKEVEPDFGAGWEDICFNSGPIVGVDFMRSVVAPRYKRITDMLARHGCHITWIDCDGNVTPIVDAFLAGGVNCLFPVEVHGGSDPVALRHRWPGIRMQGGVDKMILLKGKAAVRKEIERLLPLVQEGGFLPGIDHRVQADAGFETYRYYLKLKRDLLGVGGIPQYDERLIG